MSRALLPLGDTLRRVSLDSLRMAPLPNLTPLDAGQVLYRLRSMGLDALRLRWDIEDCKITSDWHYPVAEG